MPLTWTFTLHFGGFVNGNFHSDEITVMRPVIQIPWAALPASSWEIIADNPTKPGCSLS
jgi:hypothetical protein